AVVGVYRNRDAERARRVEIPLVSRGGDAARRTGGHPAPCEAECDEPVVRMRLPVPVQTRKVGEIDRLVAGLALRGAVGEARAEPGFPERAQIRRGVFGSADVVAPVVDGGD